MLPKAATECFAKPALKRNAQGALEYLLLIGGAVLVSGIVLVMVIGTSGGGSSQAQ